MHGNNELVENISLPRKHEERLSWTLHNDGNLTRLVKVEGMSRSSPMNRIFPLSSYAKLQVARLSPPPPSPDQIVFPEKLAIKETHTLRERVHPFLLLYFPSSLFYYSSLLPFFSPFFSTRYFPGRASIVNYSLITLSEANKLHLFFFFFVVDFDKSEEGN